MEYILCNTFSYSYVNLLVLATISNYSIHSNGSFKVDNQSFRPVQFTFMDQEHVSEKKFAIQPGQHSPYSDSVMVQTTAESWFISRNRQKIFLISNVYRLALETGWPSVGGYHGLFPRNCQAGALILSFPSTM